MNRWISEQPTVHAVEMTPELARDLLALNNPKRHVCHQPCQLVSLYAAQMHSGDWSPTFDTIKVNVSGGLMDGQHRLWATVLAGHSWPALVVTGVPDHAAYAMDPPGKVAA